MRVLYVVDTLNVGGTETQMARAAMCLRRAGHQVTVACLRAEGPLLELLRSSGIPVVEFLKKKTLVSFNGLYQLGRMVCFMLWHKFQVVHTHDLWANLFGVPAAWLAGTRVIISSRRYLADLDWSTPWRNKIMRTIYRLSTRVITNSEAVRSMLLEREGLPPEKVQVVYNAVDVDRFALDGKRRRGVAVSGVGETSRPIAVVANMYSPVKGHVNLVRAARTVCRQEPEAVFLLIGDGRERPRLEQQVVAAGLKKNFIFLGQRDDVSELLASCDLFVLPSDAEGLPNALLEAMAAELPAVATWVGGIPEVIKNGVNGLLVPPRDPQALAHAILLVLRDGELAARLARAGKRRVCADFSFERLTAQLERIYAPATPAALGGTSAARVNRVHSHH